MSDTNFLQRNTKIKTSWLQDVNNFVYRIFGGASTVPQARTALDVYSSGEVDVKTWDYTTQITGTPTALPGRLLKVTQYTNTTQGTTSSYVFTALAATSFVIVEVQANGGAGFGVTTTGNSAGGPGGGSGAYCKALITSGFSGVTVALKGPTDPTVIQSGGTTGFGVGGPGLVLCKGGGTNALTIGTTTPSAFSSSITSTPPIITVNPPAIALEVNYGGYGQPGVAYGTSTQTAVGGAGAQSKFGPGGKEAVCIFGFTNGVSADITAYGAGGGGAARLNSTGTTYGGVGGGSCVTVYEYS